MVWCPKWAERLVLHYTGRFHSSADRSGNHLRSFGKQRSWPRPPKAEENGVEILITIPNSKSTEQCAAVTISQPGETEILLLGQVEHLFETCVQQAEKVIWLLSCEDGEQNKNIKRIMNNMGVKFFTIIDLGCPVQSSSFIWLTPNISPQQIQALYRQAASGWREIEDNPPLVFVETNNESPSSWTRPRAPTTNHRKRRIYLNWLLQRAKVSVVRQKKFRSGRLGLSIEQSEDEEFGPSI